MMVFNVALAELSQRVGKHRRLGASEGFRASLKSRPIYSHHILDQWLEN